MKPQPPLHGESLVPELLSGKRARKEPVFHQLFLMERGWAGEDTLAMVRVRTDRLKLVHDRDQYELFDYRADPLEAKDRATSPNDGETLSSLKSVLRDFTYAVHRGAEQPRSALRRDGRRCVAE